MLVLAGPGTGKTRVITHRIAHLIRERGVRPETIVALTFTVKSADSMRGRLAELVGAGASEGIFAGTFHSFAKMLVRRFPDRLGFDRAPIIMDSAMRRRLLREIVASRVTTDPLGASAGESWVDELRGVIAHLHHHAVSPQRAQEFIQQWHSALEAGHQVGDETLTLDEVCIEAQREALERFRRVVGVFKAFEQERRNRSWMGFDEMLIEPIRLLREDPRAAAICRDDYRHIVVDEYQDTNAAQAELLAMLAPPGQSRDLVVVGDDDQSIYEFRGADDLAFDRFARRWQGCAQVRLERNYRSLPQVINAANTLIARATHRFAPEKRIEAAGLHAGAQGSVELLELADFKNDGDAIASMIRADRQHSLEVNGTERPWSSYAVIVRTHNDAERITNAFELLGVPFTGRRPGSVIEDAGVQRLLAWVELLADPNAAWAARGVLMSPPVAAPPEAMLNWEKQYRAARSRGAMGLGFATWLTQREEADDTPEARGAIERFTNLYTKLQACAQEHNADHTVVEIIRSAGLADSELLTGRERASRVRNLVEAIRFTRSLQPRLPQPGNVSAFWSYYNDLDATDQTMGKAMGEDAIDSDGYEEDGEGWSDSAGVAVLTAHSSKGLEFDTVFVPRIFGPSGYPSSKNARTKPLPDGIVQTVGDQRNDKERMYDEERRLLYVAMTRAERRAVLLTKKTKSPSKTVHFAQQLATDMGASLVRLKESEVLIEPGDAIEQEMTTRAMAAESAERVRAARRSAAEFLAQAGSAREREEFEKAMEELRTAAEIIATEAFAERGDAHPQWLGDHAPVVRTQTHIPALFKPVTGPLHLSYTTVNSYLTCPRCWYMDFAYRLTARPGPELMVGSATHKALQRFYERHRYAEAEGNPLPGLDVMEAEARDAYEQTLQHDEPVDELLRARVVSMSLAAHQSLHEPHAEILEIERKYVMDWPAAGEGSTLEARIDRLDRVNGGHRLVDYKTGRPRKDLVTPKPRDLQMGIYALVLQQEMEGIEGWAEYWLLQSGQRGKIALAELDTAWAEEQVALAVDGIRSGRFESGKSCQACSWLDASGVQRGDDTEVGDQ